MLFSRFVYAKAAERWPSCVLWVCRAGRPLQPCTWPLFAAIRPVGTFVSHRSRCPSRTPTTRAPSRDPPRASKPRSRGRWRSILGAFTLRSKKMTQGAKLVWFSLGFSCLPGPLFTKYHFCTMSQGLSSRKGWAPTGLQLICNFYNAKT